MPGYHARISPSSSHTWTACPASIRLQSGIPNKGSAAAEWGTIAHDLAERCLRRGDFTEFDFRAGQQGVVNDQGAVVYVPPDSALMPGYNRHDIDDEMGDCVRTYVRFVLDLVEKGNGTLYVEQKVAIEHITGEDGATGTSDAVIVFPDELCIVDLKGGIGVKVHAGEATGDTAMVIGADDWVSVDIRRPNPQLVMYADGALLEHGLFNDFKTVRYIIVQPRLGHIDELVVTIAEHVAEVARITACAAAARAADAPAVPGERQCRWCRANGAVDEAGAFLCKASRDAVLHEAFGDFDSLPEADVRAVDDADLPAVYAKLDLIRGFCKAVEERVDERLKAGLPVPGYKLVEGRAGNRKWVSEEKAVELLKSFRLKDDEMFHKSVISPADAEKRFKKEQPRRWTKIEALITRADGAPKVAPVSDPRPAITLNAVDDFADETPTPAAPATEPAGEDLAAFF